MRIRADCQAGAIQRCPVVYYRLFKTNLAQVRDHPRLQNYLRRIHALPGIAETVSFDPIKAGCYSIRALNPNGIVPRGPRPDWLD